MLTPEEIKSIKNSTIIDIQDVLYGRLRAEEIEGYIKRELKENLLAQGYELPPELNDPDDESVSTPEWLKERAEPDTRSRFSGEYDGGEYEEVPHYGSKLYYQWKAVKEGRFSYLRAYDLSGREIKITKGMERRLTSRARDVLLDKASNPISNDQKRYKWFRVKKEDLDIRDERIAFVTSYLFPKT